MIALKIYGQGSVPKNEVRQLVDWLGRRLKIDRYQTPVEVLLRFQKMKYSGDMIADDVCARPRDFTVRIRQDMKRLKTIGTICHEFVHIWQEATGKWQWTNDVRKYKWRKKLVSIVGLRYEQYPWEIEAYQMEKVLRSEYLKLKREGKL